MIDPQSAGRDLVRTVVLSLTAAVALCSRLTALPATPEEIDKLPAKERQEALFRLTPPYRQEALRLILSEANHVARELRLSQRLPITEDTLVGAYISPPRLRRFSPGFGNVSTANYTYFVTVGSKLSYVVRTHLDREYKEYETHYRWPWSRVDTNAAYRLATNWLRAASMDVVSLNRECKVSVSPWVPNGPGHPFVPLYTVTWSKADEPVAMVQLLQPEKRLCQMHVERSEYILRKPVVVPNAEVLLSQTNALVSTEKNR